MDFVFKISALNLQNGLSALEIFREEMASLYSGSEGPGGESENPIFSGSVLIQFPTASTPSGSWSSVVVPFWES